MLQSIKKNCLLAAEETENSWAMHDDGFVAFFLTKYEKMAIFGFPFVTKLDKNISDIIFFWENKFMKNQSIKQDVRIYPQT